MTGASAVMTKPISAAAPLCVEPISSAAHIRHCLCWPAPVLTAFTRDLSDHPAPGNVLGVLFLKCPAAVAHLLLRLHLCFPARMWSLY